MVADGAAARSPLALGDVAASLFGMAWLPDGSSFGSTRQARELDARAAAELGLSGLVLMETAGGQAAEAVWREWLARSNSAPARPRLAILCGAGNNGGDGFVVARRLKDRADVVCLVASAAQAAPPDASTMRRAAEACGVVVLDLRTPEGMDAGLSRLREARIVVDAVLGTGARRPVQQGARVLLGALAACRPVDPPQGACARPLVVALDLPSGGCGDTGECDLLTPRCDLTVTFGLAKHGLRLPPLAALAGRIELADLGLPLAFRTQPSAGNGRKDLP